MSALKKASRKRTVKKANSRPKRQAVKSGAGASQRDDLVAPPSAEIQPPVKKTPRWIVPLLIVAAVLVVAEVGLVMKNKVDKQRTLLWQGNFGTRFQDQVDSFKGTYYLKIDGQNRLFLVDPDSSKIVVYDTKQRKFLMAIDAQRVQNKDFAPRNLCVDQAGTIYVLDTVHQEISVLDQAGVFQKKWPAANVEAIAVSKDGNILASSGQGGQIITYSPDGTELNRFGRPGSGDGQLKSPYRLTVDGKGNIYVLDVGNKRVQVFNAQGAYVTQWPMRNNPEQITSIFISQDEIYISSFEMGKIWCFSLKGKLNGVIEIAGPSCVDADSEGNFYLPSPSGIGWYKQLRGKQ